MGVETGRTFATSINASFHNMTIVPEHWSMAEAATIINAYATLYYALIQRANLKQGESILIHSAAGGVGQAAINMCRHYGCDIYVTVGTVEKRRFLINEYNLPEARILNSRDILFKHQVMRLTEGRGVDIVLNSLAGEKLDISYQCVAKRGRIVEIGKYDMFHNRPVGMYDLLRDIQLIGVALDIVLMEDMEFFGQFAQWMHNNCANGCVKPINYTLFPATDADKAFRYMTTGKHIGKVVINIRDTEQPLIPAPSMTVSVKTFFDPNKSYIITGGLGGLGLELISWLQYYGARKFVVTSRGGLNTAYRKWMHARFRQVYERVKYFLSDWVVSTADGLTIGGARQLVSEAEGLAPIGGVFNLALVLNDSLLESQTCAKFRQSVDTKYRICANLDEITRRLDYRVDYFVVFSSVSCGKGNAGQSNYSYGNSMCERLCEGRRRDGHHGLAVQYGPVDDVGAYADAADHALTRMTTMRAQRVHSCFDVLDKLLAIKQPIVTSYKIVTQIKQSGSIKTRMVAELWRALGVDPDSTPDHITLGEIGLESIYAVEVQQEFQKQYNTHVTLNQIKSITIGMFKEYESGNITNIKKHLEAIKRARSVLLKQKFIMPSDKYTRLNALTTGHPVYFMPTILLNFSLIEELALKLNRPAIGLNWTREVSQLTTLKAVNKYYRNLLRHIEPTANYDVVGYLDSIILCTKLLRKGMANRAVILDTVTNWRFLEEQPTDASALEFMVNLIGDEWMPAAIRHRVVRQMRAESDVSAKIGVIVREVTEVTGSALVATDMDEIFRVMYARVRMLSEYGRATKLAKLKMSMAKGWAKMRSSKLTIIKPVLGDTTGEGVNDKSFVDLLLPESQFTITRRDDTRAVFTLRSLSVTRSAKQLFIVSRV
ncbi:unnamed protein product [Oppiella nova]|uniref:Carrier domain-containing protein n=1 Tax=Oppiella nova TaxID=334625 RepID=A0A7R9M1P9_9ACAR|nr:unnamed protein product [Oppiella nova]CAG2169008.1 unnamed protein product [Oppiella nova]